MQILKAVAMDAAQLALIAAALPQAAGWQAVDFLKSIQSQNATVFKILVGDNTAGFICYSGAGAFWELVNFAVAAQFSRRGLGTSLLQTSLKELANAGVKEVTLEVNINNVTALALYKKAGFNQVGLRKRFYNNKYDALIMAVNL